MRIGLPAALLTIAFALAPANPGRVAAEPVAVRFIEGVTRGFLTVSGLDGKSLGQGDITQVAHPGYVESRMIFRLHDGSLHDESVTFTQNKVFKLGRLKIVQKGPSFPEPAEISLDAATGEYLVKAFPGDASREKIHRGTLEVPPDTYNGLIVTVLRNLPRGAAASVHYVAFTPKPYVINLELRPQANQKVRVGDESWPVTRYDLEPRLGFLLKLGATLLGKTPERQRCWILADPVPAFVGCEATIAGGGPLWRIGLGSPAPTPTTAAKR
jgi:hypothetical protein